MKTCGDRPRWPMGAALPVARTFERGQWHRASATEGTLFSGLSKPLALTRGGGSGSIERKRQFRLPPPIASLPVEFSRERSEAKKVPEEYASILRGPTEDSRRKAEKSAGG